MRSISTVHPAGGLNAKDHMYSSFNWSPERASPALSVLPKNQIKSTPKRVLRQFCLKCRIMHGVLDLAKIEVLSAHRNT